jgi:hypothetical protein
VTAQALRLAGRCTLVSFGYVIAVFVATTVALLCMALPDLFGRSSPQRIMQFFGDTFVAGLMVTFLSALPGFLIAICFAIVYRWKVWAAYAAAGTANGAFALALFGTYLVGKMWPDPHVLLASLAGGFVGGFSFWAAGGRYAGFWRGKAEL